MEKSGSEANQRHVDKINRILAGIRTRLDAGEPLQFKKASVSHVVPLPLSMRTQKKDPIDLSDLTEILEINVEDKFCITEPGVTFAQLVKQTLALGLVPVVVPELEDITIGGGVAGCSVESMSYKFGGFHDNCSEYEVITGDGKLLKISPDTDPLSFEMMHGSYGTLAVLTCVKFRLVPAQNYVRMEYRHFQDFESFNAEMLRLCEERKTDFIDGIIHSKNKFTLCLGHFVDSAPYLSDYRWLNIYYKSTRDRTEDFLTTYDYFFRYDTECHWLTKNIPGLENKAVRLLAGKFVLGSTNLIKWVRRLDYVHRLKKRPDVIVDIFIPATRLESFYSWYAKDFDFFPLWIVPYRLPKMYPWVGEKYSEKMDTLLFIDCAIYGRSNTEADVDYSQVLEEKTYELAGIKTLISRNHFTKDRFWEVYNEPNYRSVKKKLDPQGKLPDLYKKLGQLH